MPNWAAGTLKIRGTKENIIRFLTEGVHPVTYIGNGIEREIKQDEYSFEVSSLGGSSFYINGTVRNFIEGESITFYFDDEEEETCILVLDGFKAAWSLEAGPLLDISKEYQLDFRVYVFERGQEFNQEIEIHKGELIKSSIINFDDYRWECVCPNLGG
jgi:hypothetical protein